jgi:hypothetical protein
MQSDPAHGRDDELVKKVARAIYEAEGGIAWERLYEPIEAAYWTIARRTLAVARPVIREECAKVVEVTIYLLSIVDPREPPFIRDKRICEETREQAAAAIRAME